MEKQTMKQMRLIAKDRGLINYWKLRMADLVQLLSQPMLVQPIPNVNVPISVQLILGSSIINQAWGGFKKKISQAWSDFKKKTSQTRGGFMKKTTQALMQLRVY